MLQLLWIEVALKGAVALVLILAPMTFVRLLGLQRTEQRFWPRIAGFMLLGIAAGVLLTLLVPTARGGIGPAGLIAINLAAASGLIAPLVWGTAAPFRRGRFLILGAALVLLTLAFLEIAHI